MHYAGSRRIQGLGPLAAQTSCQTQNQTDFAVNFENEAVLDSESGHRVVSVPTSLDSETVGKDRDGSPVDL